MITLDSFIGTIALPSAQADLGVGAASRCWIVTAHAPAFGSLLFVGRLSDTVLRR